MQLAVDDQRIDDGAEIVDAGIFHDLDDAGVRIDLDFGDVAAVGIGRGARAVADVGDVERLRRVGRRLRAAVQLLRQLHDRDGAIGADDDEVAVLEARCRTAPASSTCAASSLPFSMTLAAASTIAVPVCMIDFEPPEPPPAASLSLSPCSSEIFSNGMPSRSLKHLRERRGVAHAEIERAGRQRHGAVGIEFDVGQFLRRRRGDFEEVADAEPAQLAALARFRACAWQSLCRRRARTPVWSAPRNRRCRRCRPTRSCTADSRGLI